MYKITTGEVVTSTNTDIVSGFLVSIEPPVVLSQEGVSRCFKKGSIRHDAENGMPRPHIAEALVIGSTDERTVLYVGLTDQINTNESTAVEQAYRDIGQITQHLLKLLGAEADTVAFYTDSPSSSLAN